MISKYLRRIATPGAFSPGVVEVASILGMMTLFALDVLYGARIWLNVLYIFPLVAMGIHCKRPALVALAFVLTVGFQTATIIAYAMPPIARAVNIFVSVAWPTLVVLLARFARASYFEIAALAHQDSLTGLPNRRQFESVIDREIARQERYGGVFSLVIADLDDFKRLNDTRGHIAGDKALVLLAKVLQESSRHSDSLARLGGDEFAILMPNTAAGDRGARCQKLSAMIASRMREAGFLTSASIGGATFEKAPESTSVALQKADKAMYVVKAARKGAAESDLAPAVAA